jgi:hypothetical protein
MWRKSVAEPAGRCEGEKPVAELRGGEEAEPHHAVERALLHRHRRSSHGEARRRGHGGGSGTRRGGESSRLSLSPPLSLFLSFSGCCGKPAMEAPLFIQAEAKHAFRRALGLPRCHTCPRVSVVAHKLVAMSRERLAHAANSLRCEISNRQLRFVLFF